MVGPNGDRREPLDDIDHLARSPHRARVMRMFSEDDWTRRELHDETGIPQPTLGRILGAFEDRNWLERDGHTYSLTFRGRLVASRFEELLDVVGTVQQLPASADFDPLFDLGFDPDWLARVEVVTPDDSDAWYAHLREVHASVGTSDHVREVAPGPMPGMPAALLDRLHSDELRIETVFPRNAFETFVADTENRSVTTELLRTGNVRIHLVDGPIRCYVALHGEQAVIDVPSEAGGPITRLETHDPAVLDWVESTVDDFRERAEPVTVDDLAE